MIYRLCKALAIVILLALAAQWMRSLWGTSDPRTIFAHRAPESSPHGGPSGQTTPTVPDANWGPGAILQPATAPTVTVAAGTPDQLIAALARAACGERILISPDAMRGNFAAPALHCGLSNWVTMVGSLGDGPDNRPIPVESAVPELTPTLRRPVLTVPSGAAYWYIANLRFRLAGDSQGAGPLIRVGTPETGRPAPDHIVLDRLLIDGANVPGRTDARLVRDALCAQPLDLVQPVPDTSPRARAHIA